MSEQFTEAQVEAAAKAIEKIPHIVWNSPTRQDAMTLARAALAAAQGAAPQSAKDIHEPNHDRVYCVRCGGNWPCQPAPALSSGGVDEAALAEVIAKSRGFGNGWEQIPPLTREAYREVARAVAAWLKGQGDTTHQNTVRYENLDPEVEKAFRIVQGVLGGLDTGVIVSEPAISALAAEVSTDLNTLTDYLQGKHIRINYLNLTSGTAHARLDSSA